MKQSVLRPLSYDHWATTKAQRLLTAFSELSIVLAIDGTFVNRRASFLSTTLSLEIKSVSLICTSLGDHDRHVAHAPTRYNYIATCMNTHSPSSVICIVFTAVPN